MQSIYNTNAQESLDLHMHEEAERRSCGNTLAANHHMRDEGFRDDWKIETMMKSGATTRLGFDMQGIILALGDKR